MGGDEGCAKGPSLDLEALQSAEDNIIIAACLSLGERVGNDDRTGYPNDERGDSRGMHDVRKVELRWLELFYGTE